LGTVRILYRASTISLQAAVYPEHTLGALNMKEKEGSRIGCFEWAHTERWQTVVKKVMNKKYFEWPSE